MTSSSKRTLTTIPGSKGPFPKSYIYMPWGMWQVPVAGTARIYGACSDLEAHLDSACFIETNQQKRKLHRRKVLQWDLWIKNIHCPSMRQMNFLTGPFWFLTHLMSRTSSLGISARSTNFDYELCASTCSHVISNRGDPFYLACTVSEGLEIVHF